MLFFVVLLQMRTLFLVLIKTFVNGLLLLVLSLFHRNLYYLLILKILIDMMTFLKGFMTTLLFIMSMQKGQSTVIPMEGGQLANY